MQRPAPSTIAVLAPEWRRVELLAGCLLGGRRGEPAPDAVLAELAEVSEAVVALREQDPWKPVTGGGLDDDEHDLLALTLAPRLFGRTAALLASIVGGSPTGVAPTPALAAELYSLEPSELPALARCLAPDGALRRRTLVALVGTDGAWHDDLLPGVGIVEQLLDVPDVVPAPPGSRAVPVDGARLEDLVVSEAVATRLDEFVRAVANRDRVPAWGLGRRAGPVAMFSGPSGVGKSLAARAIAGELGWPLFKVDLGALVSKYIGETEKNLSLLFEAAQGRRLLLHFEEAESIFGRRGEIKEARDRYANLEVSHLLSRLEAHDGPCVLSTNLRRNVDPAFMRRFTSVVEFSRPDVEQRTELWRRSLPPGALATVGDDLDALAAVDLTGGQIRNAATYACLVAAEGDADAEEAAVDTPIVTLGIWRELTKSSRQVLPADLGDLQAHLRPEHIGAEGR